MKVDIAAESEGKPVVLRCRVEGGQLLIDGILEAEKIDA